MLLKYLNQIKDGYKIFDFDIIEEAFIDNRDSENVKRIIKGGKKIFRKKNKWFKGYYGKNKK